ncbi:MAG TPA: Xaa-Pro peptidase family protein [Acidimicrobiales bacterium]|nr:Xaa-Pro peptidase family protein [Acidimicrobiales bacterium]
MSNGRERSFLPPMDVAGRMGRLRDRLAEASCDALLVTGLINVRYLTGFSGSAGMLLVTQEGALLVSDGRYRDQAREQLDAAGVEARIEIGRPAEQLTAIDGATMGIGRLGLEADVITWAVQQRLASSLSCVSAGGSLVATRGIVEELRIVKDAGELARIELAADIADVGLAQVKEHLRDDLTELQFAVELDFEMRRRGADGVSFETIVAAGPNGALPHHAPSDRRIAPGELVVIDFGAEVDGYRSDMTRTLCVGAVSSAELVDLLDAVLVAQRAGVRAIRPGVTGAEVDGACRDSLELAGYGALFVHGTGHGVGLEIHEAPALAAGSTDILVEGAVVTVEPGAYLSGVGGVRIEDTLVVTATGARALTKSTKDTIL